MQQFTHRPIVHYLHDRGTEPRDLFFLARILPERVAALLNVDPRTVRRWNRCGRYPDHALQRLAMLAGFFPVS